MAKAAPAWRSREWIRRSRFAEGHPIISEFLADRCTHLAAMVAYYALLSLLPFLFLALSLTGLVGRPDEGSYMIRELKRVVPGQSVESLVAIARSLQENAKQLSVIGALGLLWGSLGFLSAMESALNIVYGVPNRRFLRQKLFVFSLVGAGLVSLFAALVVATAAHALLDRHADDVLEVTAWHFAVTVLLSTAITFAFLLVVYRYLPNTELTVREVLPGTVLATVALQVSFEVLPLYLRFSATLPALRAFGGAVVLLVWLFLMGNVILLGAEVNWWTGRGRHERDAARTAFEQDDALGHA